MKEEQQRFLTLLGQVPMRLTAEQTAWVLNCQAPDIPILVAARLLKPLGNPPHNSVKFFAAAEVLESARDRTWLAKMTNALSGYWRAKNERKRARYPFATASGGPEEAESSATGTGG
ncbi:MAG: hypothetical protein JWM32_1602 [Verrucomicrobia bacterium]|nr:hypothetical protein [Verrucomicrobiota bacterium]